MSTAAACLEPALPATPPVVRIIAMPGDTNPSGDVFGGWLLSHMDLAAGSVATRYARGRCVTAAIDGMAFLGPVIVGDEVSIFATVIGHGRSSMRIKVEAWRRHRESEDVCKVTEAIFTSVAVDANRAPRPISPSTTPLQEAS